jgi:DNA repair protein RadD
MINLRDYQEKFVDAIRHEFHSGVQSVMGVAPTGFGKTICFSYIAHNASQLGNTTYITVHRKELVRQTSNSLLKNGIPHGVIASGYPEQDFPIQVCSIQTLSRRLDRYQPPFLLVTDEAHHSEAATYDPIIPKFNIPESDKVKRWAQNSFHLGVTATPERVDGKGFTNHFQRMVLGDDVKTLIENGWLSRPVVYAPPIEGIDLARVNTVNGEFNQDQLERMLDKPAIIGSAVEHYKRLMPHSPLTIAFTVSVDHARHLAQEFISNGIAAASLDGTMTDDERIHVLQKMGNQEIRVLTSCNLVSEGFDLSAAAGKDIAIACGILLRPTKSKALFLQQCGRVLRPATGKDETLILDHVENWKRHGMIDDPQDWSLEGRIKRGKAQRGETLATCPKCYSVFPPQPKCPGCGHSFAVVGGAPREIEERDGELVPLNTVTAQAFRRRANGFGPQVRKLERA